MDQKPIGVDYMVVYYGIAFGTEQIYKQIVYRY